MEECRVRTTHRSVVVRREWGRCVIRTIPALITAVLLLAGCQQQQEEAPNERMARLLAAENAEMRQQMMARQAGNQALQQKYAKELQQRDEELAKCKGRIAELQKDLEEGIAERVRGVTAAVVDENARLRQEVESLKAEIARLKTEQSQALTTTEGQP